MPMQAYAKHIEAVLINVAASTMLSKWVGESNKLTAAIFSLASKISCSGRPVVIFIDEIDAILGDLRSHETEWGTQVRGQPASQRGQMLFAMRLVSSPARMSLGLLCAISLRTRHIQSAAGGALTADVHAHACCCITLFACV